MSHETDRNEMIRFDDIKNKIFTIRGVQVMLDSDLAKLYAVETKVLNQAVKRNAERFPEKFHFQLMHNEYSSLRSQFVTLEYSGAKTGRHRKVQGTVSSS